MIDSSFSFKAFLELYCSNTNPPIDFIDSSTLIKNVKMPSMSEGVFLKDDKIYTYFESSGNKY